MAVALLSGCGAAGQEPAASADTPEPTAAVTETFTEAPTDAPTDAQEATPAETGSGSGEMPAISTAAPIGSFSPVFQLTDPNEDTQATEGEILLRFAEAPITPNGQIVTADGCPIITLGECYTCDELLPDNVESSYSYLEKIDGYKYLVCKGTIENNGSTEIRSAYTSVSNSRPYLVIFCIDDSTYCIGDLIFGSVDNRSISTRLAPGEKVALYVLCSIPSDGAIPENVKVYVGFSSFDEYVLNASFTGTYTVDWSMCKAEIKAEFDEITSK